MKYNVISYFLGEGFRNVFKNKKSTFSCLGVMCATMLIFGLFFAIGQNIQSMLTEIEDAQAIRVFLLQETTDDRVIEIGEEIKAIEGVNTVVPKTREESYNEVKEGLGENPALLEALEPSSFSESYVITLTDLELNESVQDKINQIDGIKRITSSNQTITALSNIGKWIRIITGSMLVILILISVFIISNTIKLTVHARRKEISIMKYVGATNNFIRTPFMIEGIIIGLISSIISVLLVGGGYDLVRNKVMQSETAHTIGINILNFSELFNEIAIVYIVLGVGIGIIGSSISMKKYLDV